MSSILPIVGVLLAGGSGGVKELEDKDIPHKLEITGQVDAVKLLYSDLTLTEPYD